MRRFATTFALLTIALSAAACDPYQAITNSLPGGCNPPSDPAPLQAHGTRPITSAPDINIPADLPNTKH